MNEACVRLALNNTFQLLIPEAQMRDPEKDHAVTGFAQLVFRNICLSLAADTNESLGWTGVELVDDT